MILCVVLHYGREDVTWECVESIIDNKFVDILIADNDPEQKIRIPDRYEGKIRIFKTGGIAGFAHANNMAVDFGRNKTHSSVMLLNNDTIVLADAIKKLQFLLDQDNIGLVGPCMPYAGNPEKVWACGGVIVKYNITIHGLKEITNTLPHDVDYLPGAAILCKLKVWDLIGGLPEKYFLAYEEAEFALKVKSYNYRVVVHPDSKILHKVGMSSDQQPMYLYNSTRNRLKFGGVLYGRCSGFILSAFWCLVGSRKSIKSIVIYFRALFDEVKGTPLNRTTLQKIKKLYK